jgi:hypothetical protein
MSQYELVNITPLKNLPPKDLRCINMASDAAEKSSFEYPRRLGACIEYGRCFLRR